MSLSGIISITGFPGLHKILSHTKNGLIVESLTDGKRRPVYSSQKVSTLEDISIYSVKEDVPLKDILMKIFEKENGKKGPDPKSDPAELRKYLTSIEESVDHERVYNSDISKLFFWYNILIEKDLLKSGEEEEQPEEKQEGVEAGQVQRNTAVKPGPKAQEKVKKADSARKTPARSGGQTRTASRKS